MSINKIFKGIGLFRKKEEPSFFTTLLGYTPADESLYVLALTHRSKQSTESNERLEYLGDAVISLVVGEALYSMYPEEDEGFLTRARSKAVCRDNLNTVAVRLHLNEHILSLNSNNNSHDVYGNAFEAIVGAIYLDAGYEEAKKFICRHLVGKNGAYLTKTITREVDFKSRLLEWGQANKKQISFVELGDNYDSKTDMHNFVFSVQIDGVERAQGAGNTKLEAQQVAARHCINSFT